MVKIMYYVRYTVYQPVGGNWGLAGLARKKSRFSRGSPLKSEGLIFVSNCAVMFVAVAADISCRASLYTVPNGLLGKALSFVSAAAIVCASRGEHSIRACRADCRRLRTTMTPDTARPRPTPAVADALLNTFKLDSEPAGLAAIASSPAKAPQSSVLVPEDDDSDDDFVDAPDAPADGDAPVPKATAAAVSSTTVPAGGADDDFGAFDEAVNAKVPQSDGSDAAKEKTGGDALASWKAQKTAKPTDASPANDESVIASPVAAPKEGLPAGAVEKLTPERAPKSTNGSPDAKEDEGKPASTSMDSKETAATRAVPTSEKITPKTPAEKAEGETAMENVKSMVDAATPTEMSSAEGAAQKPADGTTEFNSAAEKDSSKLAPETPAATPIVEKTGQKPSAPSSVLTPPAKESAAKPVPKTSAFGPKVVADSPAPKPTAEDESPSHAAQTDAAKPAADEIKPESVAVMPAPKPGMDEAPLKPVQDSSKPVAETSKPTGTAETKKLTGKGLVVNSTAGKIAAVDKSALEPTANKSTSKVIAEKAIAKPVSEKPALKPTADKITPKVVAENNVETSAGDKPTERSTAPSVPANNASSRSLPPKARPPVSPVSANGSASNSIGPSPGSTKSTKADSGDDPEMARLLAMHAKRQTARRGPLRVPRGGVSSSAPGEGISSADASKVTELEYALASLGAQHKTEMHSIHRNHVENINKVTAERDMFARELSKEQAKAKNNGSSDDDGKRVKDLTMHLRASRIRTADLQAENTRLVEEAKQLRLRDAAHKALVAEADAHDALIEELVAVKLKCAQLEEEKEVERRKAREMAASVSVLREANGELEKSRSDWVFRMAAMEEAAKAAGVDLSGESDLTSNRPKSTGSFSSQSRRAERHSGSSTSSDVLEGVKLT